MFGKNGDDLSGVDRICNDFVVVRKKMVMTLVVSMKSNDFVQE